MQGEWDFSCDQHPDPMDCPDLVVFYNPKFDEHGIPIRDGENGSAGSYVRIAYCPWCGARLPESTREG